MSTEAVFNVVNEPLTQDFEQIFREHSQMVYRTAYSVTGSPQDAEDILQTLFLGLLRRGLPPGLRENPKGYLYRSAVNLSLNAVQSRRRHLQIADPDRLESLVDPAQQEDRDDDALQKHLVQAMSQLSPRAVEMLILRYEHDYSDAEIGKLLGTSRGVIAVTMHRARTRLKKLLRGCSGEKS
jgi:RNA polymerase sigma-70 factor (ECF subfamily)